MSVLLANLAQSLAVLHFVTHVVAHFAEQTHRFAVHEDVNDVLAQDDLQVGLLIVCNLLIHGAAGAVVVAVLGVAVHYQQTTRVAIEPNARDARAVAAAVAAGGKVEDAAPAAGDRRLRALSESGPDGPYI